MFKNGKILSLGEIDLTFNSASECVDAVAFSFTSENTFYFC